MSETQTQTTKPAEPYVPQNVLASEENEDATRPLAQPPPAQQAPAEAEKPEVDPVEEERKAEKRREAARIGQLTRQKFAEKARADAEKARADAAEQKVHALQNPGAQYQPPQPDFEQAVKQRAAEEVARMKWDEDFGAWDNVGRKEFGQEEFLKASQTVAELAPTPQQLSVFSRVLLDTEGSQKAVMELSGDADEAARILALPPHKMALAIAKLGAASPPAPPAPVSKAPPPIRSPAIGRARGEPDPERGSMEDFKAWSAKQHWRR